MSDEELMRIAFADKRTVQEILRYIFELGEQKGRADATKEMDLTSEYAKGRADAIEEFVNFCINDWKMEQAVVITKEKTDCFRIGGYLSRLLEQFKDEFATK